MDGATPVAAMLTLFFNRTVEYVTPAIDVMHRSRQPLSFLIFRGMVAAIHRGYTVWNWGGTWQEQHALHHFKAGFGASERPYSYLIRASVPAVRTFREYRQKLSTLFPYFYIYPYTALGNGGAAAPARGEHVL
jgi:lipid II:glycine glycyltransferase (peptidoglycan interpeptide bridge formation enzyme)